MSHAQDALKLVYELRGSAMAAIADKMSTALGNVGAGKATAEIANRMRMLMASDVLYGAVVRPEIDGVLAANGIDGSDVPRSAFLPDGNQLARRRRDQHGARPRSAGRAARRPPACTGWA